jgi:hypothetical protein
MQIFKYSHILENRKCNTKENTKNEKRRKMMMGSGPTKQRESTEYA